MTERETTLHTKKERSLSVLMRSCHWLAEMESFQASCELFENDVITTLECRYGVECTSLQQAVFRELFLYFVLDQQQKFTCEVCQHWNQGVSSTLLVNMSCDDEPSTWRIVGQPTLTSHMTSTPSDGGGKST